MEWGASWRQQRRERPRRGWGAGHSHSGERGLPTPPLHTSTCQPCLPVRLHRVFTAPQSHYSWPVPVQTALPAYGSPGHLMARPAAKHGVTVSHWDCHHAYSRLLCGLEDGDVVEDYRDDYVKIFLTILPEIDLKEPLPPFSTKT